MDNFSTAPESSEESTSTSENNTQSNEKSTIVAGTVICA